VFYAMPLSQYTLSSSELSLGLSEIDQGAADLALTTDAFVARMNIRLKHRAFQYPQSTVLVSDDEYLAHVWIPLVLIMKYCTKPGLVKTANLVTLLDTFKYFLIQNSKFVRFLSGKATDHVRVVKIIANNVAKLSAMLDSVQKAASLEQPDAQKTLRSAHVASSVGTMDSAPASWKLCECA
jgi:hypothetical protein